MKVFNTLTLLLASFEAANGCRWMALKHPARGKKAKKASKQRPSRVGGDGPNVFQFFTTCMVQATKTMTMANDTWISL